MGNSFQLDMIFVVFTKISTTALSDQGAGGRCVTWHWPAMVKTKGDGLRSLPSRKHSCSELQKGNKALLKVKAENQDPDEFAAKIQG